MTSKKTAGEGAPGPFTVELDEELLREAVAAVDAYSPKRRRPASEAAPRPAPPAAATGVVELEQEIEIAIPSTSPPGPAAEPEAYSEPAQVRGLDLAAMAREWDRMVAELERARQERDAARQRIEHELRERTRQAVRLKRMTEQNEQLQGALHAAEEARRSAEAETIRVRDEARGAQEAATRLRERLRRGEEEARLYGHAAAILAILPIAENLDRASQHAFTSPDQVGTGLQMIQRQLADALTRVGVRRIDASVGAPFQPALHEAVIQVSLEGFKPGTVAAELQPGYTLNGRLLRAARVSIVAPPVAESAAGALSEGELIALSDDSQAAPTRDTSEPAGPGESTAGQESAE